MADEDEVSALRNRYIEWMSGELPAENARTILNDAEEMCASLAKEETLANREAQIRATEAALLAATKTVSHAQPFMSLFCSYLRERVALVVAEGGPAQPMQFFQAPALTTTLAKLAPLPPENQSLFDLRESFLSRIMESHRPTQWQQREVVQNFLFSLDQRCENLATRQAPQLREVIMRAMQAALHTMIESDPKSELFVGLLESYLQERVTILIQGAPPISGDSPRIIVKALIIPGDRTKEGTLVKGVSSLWFEIMRMIQADPDTIHRIDCWKWEEIVAGAYNQEGWETVVLTPKKGDKGRDIIAERKDWGQLRFLLLDQVKSYAPDHLVGPDEIREMAGVLHREQGATKGLITTTSGFSPGALQEAEYLFPRLELKPRDKLLPWLASVAVEDLGLSKTSGKGPGDG